jgi:hypothetical protein
VYLTIRSVIVRAWSLTAITAIADRTRATSRWPRGSSRIKVFAACRAAARQALSRESEQGRRRVHV